MRAVVVCFLCLTGCTHTAYTLRGKVDVPATLTIREYSDDLEVLTTARTRANGSFAVAIPADREEPNAPVWLIVRAPGRATDVLFVGLVDEPVEVNLGAGGTAAGRVVDPSGTPLRGAQVARPSHYEGPPVCECTETDAEGRFRLAGIDAEGDVLSVGCPGFDWRTVRAGPDVEVVLQPLAEVRGRVLAEGRPVAGARFYEWWGHRPFFVTGADGRYRTWRPRFNDYEVDKFLVAADGFRIRQCAYDGGDIRLEPCAPVTGAVLGPDGVAVAGAAVTLLAAGLCQKRETGADGRFRFDAVPAEDEILPAGLAVEKRGLVPFTGEPDTQQAMTVRLARGARFTGRVVRDGKPAPGTGVAAVGRGGPEREGYTGREVWRWAIAGPDGRFVLDGVSVDADGVFAWRSVNQYRRDDLDFREYRSPTRLVSPQQGATYDLGDIELHNHLPLRGRVLDHLGQPVAKLKLICRPLWVWGREEGDETTRTDGSGRFVFKDLPVGGWNLLAGPEKDWLLADVVYPGDILEYRLEPPE